MPTMCSIKCRTSWGNSGKFRPPLLPGCAFPLIGFCRCADRFRRFPSLRLILDRSVETRRAASLPSNFVGWREWPAPRLWPETSRPLRRETRHAASLPSNSVAGGSGLCCVSGQRPPGHREGRRGTPRLYHRRSSGWREWSAPRSFPEPSPEAFRKLESRYPSSSGTGRRV